MIKLIKHLKPFIWAIVAIFALLFGQAMTDLALPGYMADIVNIGIQSSGVESAGNLPGLSNSGHICRKNKNPATR